MAVDRFQLTVEASTRGEQDLARLENAVNRFSAAAEKSGKKAVDMGNSMAASGQQIREALQNPLQAAQSGLDALASRFGSAGAGAGIFVTAITAAGTAVYKLAAAYGDLYEQQSNNATRLGVTIREYGTLSRVSEEAGLSGDALVGTMRGLSKALSDNSAEGSAASEALRRIGVSGKDAFGAVRPMRDILLDIADKLGAIQNPAERAEIAMKVLGRSGLEVLPLMNSELRQQVSELEKSSLAWTQWGAATGAATDKAMDRVSRRIAEVTKELKRFAAETFLLFVDPSTLEQNRKERVNQRRDFQNTQMLRLMGQGIPGVGGVTTEQIQAMRQGQAQSRIQSIMGTAPKFLLDEARKDLADAIKEADVEGVIRLRSTIAGLEARIKQAELDAKNGTYQVSSDKLRSPYEIRSLLRPGEKAGPQNLSSFGASLGPSLLRAGEGVNRGAMGGDPAQIEAAQQRSLEALRLGVEYQTRKLALIAGPGGEIAAVQQATALKLAALEREKELGVSLFDIEKQRLEITREGELRILEIQKQRRENTRAQGASIFDALLAGGSGIKGYASGIGLGAGRTIFSNIYGEVAGGLAGKLSLTNSTTSTFGRILQGTPFGANPAAQAGAVQLSAGQLQLQAGTKMLAAAAMMGGGGLTAGLSSLPKAAGNVFEQTLPWLAPTGTTTAKTGGNLARNLGLAGAGAAATFGAISGIQQGGARGALTTTASLAGGVAAILPSILPSLSLAGPIGGAIAIGATLAMAFLPDPKEARRRSLEEQARQRQYEEAVGTEYMSDLGGRAVDYSKRGDVRVYLNVNAMDASSIIDRQEDIGEAVRQALSSYPPLAMDIKGATLGV